MSTPLRLRAPAKINTYLEVVGRRADGYHELRMLLVPVALFDDLVLERLADEGRVEVEAVGDACVESGDGNLCARAARYFFEATGVGGGVRIRVEKHIPVGAGLGGGSSDAAATLLGLEELCGVRLSHEARRQAAFRVGADVPFFFARAPAWVEGVGESVRSVELPEPFWVVLVHPGVLLSTAAVFGRFAGLRPPGAPPARPDWPTPPAQAVAGSTKELTTPGQPHTISAFRFQGVVAGLRNDLEGPALALEPEVGRVLDALAATGAPGVLMSGSGSAAFGLFPDERGARRAAEQLVQTARTAGWRVDTVQTLAAGSFPFVP